MTYKTENLTIIEGLEVIRKRPTMYIGAGGAEDSPLRARLVEVALEGVAADVPVPSAIRVTRWSAEQRLAFSGAILNALSERLVVSTVNGAERYRVVFAKGMVVSLLGKAPCKAPLGTNWLTFLPDTGLLGGSVSAIDAEQIVARVGRRHPATTFLDRGTRDADWY